jgi:16S rRNA (uracil1498-N3)-methyltransferase
MAVVPLLEWLATSGQHPYDLKFVLDPEGHITLNDGCFSRNEISSVCLIIGPESGLTPSELQEAAKRGFAAIRLGSRILRAETAAIAAVTALQMKWGDLVA